MLTTEFSLHQTINWHHLDSQSSTTSGDYQDSNLDSAVNDIDQAMATAMSEAQESNSEVESADGSTGGEADVVI